MTNLTNHFENATIQISGTGTAERKRISCSFQGVDGKRMSLVAFERVPASTALMVEYNDALFLGEVVACTQDVASAWHMEVRIEQILTGLESLMNLRANLLGEAVPVAPRMVPAGSRI